MLVLGHHPFKFGPKFYAWHKSMVNLQLVRFYIGSQASYYNLFLMLNVYDPAKVTQGFVEASQKDTHKALTAFNPALTDCLDRETTLGIALRDQQQAVKGFTNSNYLDAVGPRTHHVLEGEGSFFCLTTQQSFEYKVGDILLFQEEDYGRQYLNRISSDRTVQLTTCWGPSSRPHNWELFATYEKRLGIKRARG